MFLFYFAVSKQTTHLTNSVALLSLSLFPPPAIYLCKRTMQNKARLELADYEAVSTLSFWFSDCQEALSSMLSLCMDHNMMTLWISCFLSLCWKTNKRAGTVSAGTLTCQNPFFPAKSHYQITDFYLLSFIWLLSLSEVIFQENHLSEYSALIH